MPEIAQLQDNETRRKQLDDRARDDVAGEEAGVQLGVIEQRNGSWETKHIALDERSIEALQKRMNQLSR